MLVIVGPAHKPQFDAYLDKVHEFAMQGTVNALR